MKRFTRMMAIVLLVGMVATSLTAQGSADTASATASAPITAAKNLATTIVESEDLAAVVAATEAALSWGGVTVADSTTTYLKAKGPRAAVRTIPLEVLNLALEARDRETAGRLTLDELADMVDDFGSPFPTGSDPGKKTVKLLKIWIAEAKKRPDDPRSFTPLFLKNMAARQVPAINLAAGDYAPEELRLTLLEAELFNAAFMRVKVDGKYPASPPSPPSPPSPSARRQVSQPCSDWKDKFNKELPLGGDLVGAGVSSQVGDALEKAVEKITGSKLKAKRFGKFVSGANIAARIIKLLAIYGTATVKVFFSDPGNGYALLTEVHKPEEQINVPSERRVAPTAVAGLSEEDWEQYQREVDELGKESVERSQAVKDCFGFIGLPTFTEIADLGAEMTKWRIKWTIDTNPAHARINGEDSNFDFASPMGHYLKRLSDHEAGAQMAMDVLPEREEDHPGVEYVVPVVATAELDVSQPPSLQTFIDAASGPMGLASSLVEVGAGWLQSTAGPTASTSMDVSFHVGGLCTTLMKRAPQHSTPAAQGCGGQLTITWTDEWSIGSDTYEYVTYSADHSAQVNLKLARSDYDPNSFEDAASSYTYAGSGQSTSGGNCPDVNNFNIESSGTWDPGGGPGGYLDNATDTFWLGGIYSDAVRSSHGTNCGGSYSSGEQESVFIPINCPIGGFQYYAYQQTAKTDAGRTFTLDCSDTWPYPPDSGKQGQQTIHVTGTIVLRNGQISSGP